MEAGISTLPGIALRCHDRPSPNFPTARRLRILHVLGRTHRATTVAGHIKKSSGTAIVGTSWANDRAVKRLGGSVCNSGVFNWWEIEMTKCCYCTGDCRRLGYCPGGKRIVDHNYEGLPIIPPKRPQPQSPTDGAVAICGECGLRITKVMSYVCTKPNCPCFPQITCSLNKTENAR